MGIITVNAVTQGDDGKGGKRPTQVSAQVQVPDPPPPHVISGLSAPPAAATFSEVLQRVSDPTIGGSGGHNPSGRNLYQGSERRLERESDRADIDPIHALLAQVNSHLGGIIGELMLLNENGARESTARHKARTRSGDQVKEFPISPFEQAILDVFKELYTPQEGWKRFVVEFIDQAVWDLSADCYRENINNTERSVRRLVWRSENPEKSGFLAGVELPFEKHIMHLQTALQLLALPPERTAEILRQALTRVDRAAQAQHDSIGKLTEDERPVLAWG